MHVIDMTITVINFAVWRRVDEKAVSKIYNLNYVYPGVWVGGGGGLGVGKLESLINNNQF